MQESRSSRELSRRTFLAGTAGLVAATVADCSGGSSSRVSKSSRNNTAHPLATRRERQPGQRWDPSRPEGTDLLPQISHIVVVMMENHSYDNYLGMLGRGDGFTVGANGLPTNSCPAPDGRPLAAFHMGNTCQFPKVPAQNWNATHTQWDSGKMDGFVRSESGPVSMGYWTGKDLPFYYGLAQTFPVCDRWFGSAMAQTYPNRRFLLAGTARGNIRTNADTLSDPPPPNGTIMEALNRHSVPWRDYYSDVPTIGLFLPVLEANADKAQKVERFFADAAAGTLPAFCLVEPNFDHGSEENSDDITVGERFVSEVINAAMHGSGWRRTLVIWVYDEHGGYYDHVAPPAAPAPDDVGPNLLPGDVPGAYDRLGFRVPAAIISPYSRKHYVSHVVHDHTSVLALIEHKFNLPALTRRDGWADDLLDSLDLNSSPAFAQPPEIPPPANRNPVDGQGLPAPTCTAGAPYPSV